MLVAFVAYKLLTPTESRTSESAEMKRASDIDGDKFSSKLKKFADKFPMKTLKINRLSDLGMAPLDNNNNKNNGNSNLKLSSKPEKTESNTPSKALMSDEDRVVLQTCDELFKDCDEFVQMATTTINLSRGSDGSAKKLVPVKLSSALNKWRAKRQGTQLFGSYDSLMARVQMSEIDLHNQTDRALRDNSSFVVQSNYIKQRLKACIAHNSEQVAINGPRVAEAALLLDNLSQQERSLQSMLDFFVEVDRLKQAKADADANEYIPWALRSVMAAASSPNSPPTSPTSNNNSMQPTLKQSSIEKRLRKVHKVCDKLYCSIKPCCNYECTYTYRSSDRTNPHAV